MNLELFAAKDIMKDDPKVVKVRESVAHLAALLLETPHGGFPVVKTPVSGKTTFFGFINR